MTFTLKVWYAATGEDDEPQTHKGLSADRMEVGVDSFLRDMMRLEGTGVRRLTIEVAP